MNGIRLFFFVPAIEDGENGADSYSRTNYYLLEINSNKRLEWRSWLDKKSLKGDITLNMIGLKNLLAIANDKNDNRVTYYNGAEMYQLNFDNSNNIGYDGERQLAKIFPEFVRTEKSDDNNKIDFWLYNTPCQLKTFAHGITEYTSNVLDSQCKKRGLSKVNMTLKELLTWKFYNYSE